MSGTQQDIHTVATIDDAIAWLTAVRDGEWTWTRNARCKYVELCIDTRAGLYAIKDRDGERISLADLTFQYGKERG